MARWVWRALYGLVVVAVAGQLALSLYIAWHSAGGDFGKLYYGWHQPEPYGPTAASRPTWRGLPHSWYRNLNPPHVFLLAWPFAALPNRVAWLCWLVVQVGSLAALVICAVRRGSGSGWPAMR